MDVDIFEFFSFAHIICLNVFEYNIYWIMNVKINWIIGISVMKLFINNEFMENQSVILKWRESLDRVIITKVGIEMKMISFKNQELNQKWHEILLAPVDLPDSFLFLFLNTSLIHFLLHKHLSDCTSSKRKMNCWKLDNA